MTSRLTENAALRKARFLSQALILSGMLNIGLLSTFIYVVLQEKKEAHPIELRPLKEHAPAAAITNTALLKAYSVLPFQELLLRLEKKERAEEGLYERDLALTCLTAFHHFNIDKALSGFPIQKRAILFSNAEGQEQLELPIYPGLTDDQFQAITRYAKTEKWPLTSQGLFYELKRSFHLKDSSLLDAFCLTSEYQAAHLLFSKTGISLTNERLASLLFEGEWKILSDFTLSQRQALDLSAECRRTFLLKYLDGHSKTAAELLLETDSEFVLKRCDDAQILSVLDLSESSCEGLLDNFAKMLLSSPRTDSVWKRAAAALYASAKEQIPEPYDHRVVLQRFLPQQNVAAEPISQPKTITKLYTIENGDNLWKISRKFHVSIEEIKNANHLETEKLRPGKQLIIPDPKK
jgi:hypothetical protein